jgi:hypothetical protein
MVALFYAFAILEESQHERPDMQPRSVQCDCMRSPGGLRVTEWFHLTSTLTGEISPIWDLEKAKQRKLKEINFGPYTVNFHSQPKVASRPYVSNELLRQILNRVR